MLRLPPPSVLRKRVTDYFEHLLRANNGNVIYEDRTDQSDHVREAYYEMVATNMYSDAVVVRRAFVLPRTDMVLIVMDMGKQVQKCLAVSVGTLIDFVHDCFCSEQDEYKGIRGAVTSHAQLPRFMCNCLFACPHDIVISKFSKLVADPFVCVCSATDYPTTSRVINASTLLIVNAISLDIPLAALDIPDESAGSSGRIDGALVTGTFGFEDAEESRKRRATMQRNLICAVFVRCLSCMVHFQKAASSQESIENIAKLLQQQVAETFTFKEICAKVADNPNRFLVPLLPDIDNCMHAILQRWMVCATVFTGMLPYRTCTPAIVPVMPLVAEPDMTYELLQILLSLTHNQAQATDFLRQFVLVYGDTAEAIVEFNKSNVLIAMPNSAITALSLEACLWGFADPLLIRSNELKKAPVFAFNHKIADSFVFSRRMGRHCLATDTMLIACLEVDYVTEMCTNGGSVFALVSFPPPPTAGHSLFLYRYVCKLIFVGNLQQARWGIAILRRWCFRNESPDDSHRLGFEMVTPKILPFIHQALPRMMAILMRMESTAASLCDNPPHLANLCCILMRLLFSASCEQFASTVWQACKAEELNETHTPTTAVCSRLANSAIKNLSNPDVVDDIALAPPLENRSELTDKLHPPPPLPPAGGAGGAAPPCNEVDNMLVLVSAMEAMAYNYGAASMDLHRMESQARAEGEADYVYCAHNGEVRMTASSFFVLPSLGCLSGMRPAVWSDAVQAVVDGVQFGKIFRE